MLSIWTRPWWREPRRANSGTLYLRASAISAHLLRCLYNILERNSSDCQLPLRALTGTFAILVSGLALRESWHLCKARRVPIPSLPPFTLSAIPMSLQPKRQSFLNGAQPSLPSILFFLHHYSRTLWYNGNHHIRRIHDSVRIREGSIVYHCIMQCVFDYPHHVLVLVFRYSPADDNEHGCDFGVWRHTFEGTSAQGRLVTRLRKSTDRGSMLLVPRTRSRPFGINVITIFLISVRIREGTIEWMKAGRF